MTWEWGAAPGRDAEPALWRSVRARADGATPDAVTSPFFLTLVDSLGVRQVLRFGRIAYEGAQPAAGARGADGARGGSRWSARAGRDSVTLAVERGARAGDRHERTSFRRIFLQMRGRFALRWEGWRAGGERHRPGVLRDLRAAVAGLRE